MAGPPLRILCVCTGNTCRSPMFALLLRRELAARGIAASVDSAGTGAGAGEPASDGARAAMLRRGLDLAEHRSRPVAGLDLALYDRICTVSSRHAAYVRAQGVPPGRIEVLGAAQGGIADPFGGDAAAYEACARELAAEAVRVADGFLLEPPG